ncbi:MAG TPA: hypothetical protein VIY48_11555 [Candidatus Paceibacterota bacterium]
MTVWTSYQGVEVVESDPKVPCRHPRWGYDKLATLSGATLLGLADDVFVVVCNDCSYNGLTGNEPYVKPEGEYLPIIKQADRVMSHRNGTHNLRSPRSPLYSEEMIKVVIKVFLKWKNIKVKNWAEAAAAELNSLGFKPYRGDAWSGSTVSHLANSYLKKDKYKNVKAAPLDEREREFLASMVHEAAERESARTGRPVVANSVRITEAKKSQTRTPVDFDQIIANQQAAKLQKEKDETEVITDKPTPTLSFAGKNSDSLPTRKLDVRAAAPVSRPAAQVSVAVANVNQDIEFIIELPDGTPMFKYKGTLMAGKTVKGIEF